MRPIYTAFHTPGRYAIEAARLRESLISFGLEHEIREVPDLSSWQANSGYTATHIAEMQAKYPDRPIVQLDADAVVWHYPWLLDELEDSGVDIAVHYRRDIELLNGTIWLAPTPGAREVIRRYQQNVKDAGNNCHNEQRMLAQAINEMGDALKVHKLPASYCAIAMDIMKDDLKGEDPVIEHLQASRESNAAGSAALETRRKRIEAINAL